MAPQNPRETRGSAPSIDLRLHYCNCRDSFALPTTEIQVDARSAIPVDRGPDGEKSDHGTDPKHNPSHHDFLHALEGGAPRGARLLVVTLRLMGNVSRLRRTATCAPRVVGQPQTRTGMYPMRASSAMMTSDY
jgi:hypothetical protein